MEEVITAAEEDKKDDIMTKEQETKVEDDMNVEDEKEVEDEQNAVVGKEKSEVPKEDNVRKEDFNFYAFAMDINRDKGIENTEDVDVGASTDDQDKQATL